jgi:site-specific DNA-methyltransferase (adenine-specific)
MLELDKIHNLDCFSATVQLDDESVDAVITDPPYPNRMNLFPETLVDGLAMLYLACKKAKKYVVFFWNPFDVPPAPPGWNEVARHVWHKPDAKSITHYEVIVCWSKEAKQKVSRVWSIPILDYRSLHDWKPHPTQKPVKLLRYLLEQYTQEGETVFDPFVGSGTTAVACQQMKRHFIATEKNPEYAQIATSRLKEPRKDSPAPEDGTTATEDPEESPEPDATVTPDEMSEANSDPVAEPSEKAEKKRTSHPKKETPKSTSETGKASTPK